MGLEEFLCPQAQTLTLPSSCSQRVLCRRSGECALSVVPVTPGLGVGGVSSGTPF